MTDLTDIDYIPQRSTSDSSLHGVLEGSLKEGQEDLRKGRRPTPHKSPCSRKNGETTRDSNSGQHTFGIHLIGTSWSR
jgi:hypothetical protein